MKFFIVLAAVIGIATTARYSKPLEEHFRDFANEPNINLITDEDERPPTAFSGDVMQAKITSQNSNNGKGKFSYNFETQNGINIVSIGKLKDEKTLIVSGSYSYTGADGKKYRVRYTADEFGYHPVTELEEIDKILPIVPQTTVQTAKSPLNPLTSVQFVQENLQAKNEPLFGPNSSLVTKKFNQANGPFSAAVSSLTVQGLGKGNVRANGAGISSFTSQQIGQRNIQNNRPLSKSFTNNFNGRAYVPPTRSAPFNSRTYLPPRSYIPPQNNDFSF